MQTTTKTANEIVPGDQIVVPGTEIALTVEAAEPRVRIGEDATKGRHTLIELRFGRYEFSTVERDHVLRVVA